MGNSASFTSMPSFQDHGMNLKTRELCVYGFSISVSKILKEDQHQLNEPITMVFLEQPLATPVLLKTQHRLQWRCRTVTYIYIYIYYLFRCFHPCCVCTLSLAWEPLRKSEPGPPQWKSLDSLRQAKAEISRWQHTKLNQCNRGLTEENTQLGIISPIVYFKSLIGEIFSNWGLRICSLTLLYQTQISQCPIGYIIPSWVFVIPNFG